MDDKNYSLNDIFGYLREATMILDKPVTVSSENASGNIKTQMLLSEFIAMSLANELTSETSRMASADSIAKKSDVIGAMAANYYEPVAFPKYEHFGIIMSGGKRRTLRRSKRTV